jgi:hypothetical protein
MNKRHLGVKKVQNFQLITAPSKSEKNNSLLCSHLAINKNKIKFSLMQNNKKIQQNFKIANIILRCPTRVVKKYFNKMMRRRRRKEQSGEQIGKSKSNEKFQSQQKVNAKKHIKLSIEVVVG